MSEDEKKPIKEGDPRHCSLCRKRAFLAAQEQILEEHADLFKALAEADCDPEIAKLTV